jgi:general secretion pathway protein M
MTQALAARLQPPLALGLLLLAAAAVGAVTLLPLWQVAQGYDEAITGMQQRLATQRRIADAGAGLEPRLAQLERGYASDARYLKSVSQTLASAELQGIVKRAILSKRGEILSTQIVGSEGKEGRADRVTLSVTMRATLEQTVGIFYLLETSNPYLFIDNVSVRSRAYPRRTAGTATVPPPPLDVQFEASGYLRGGAA